MTSPNPATSLFITIIKRVLFPAFFLLAALALFYTTLTAQFPTPATLTEINEPLRTHAFYQTGKGRKDYATIITLASGLRFVTAVVTKENANEILQPQYANIRVFIDRTATSTLADGAQKGYGLWVNDKQIQTVDEQLASDRFNVKVIFPLVGVLFCGLAALVFWKAK